MIDSKIKRLDAPRQAERTVPSRGVRTSRHRCLARYVRGQSDSIRQPHTEDTEGHCKAQKTPSAVLSVPSVSLCEAAVRILPGLMNQ